MKRDSIFNLPHNIKHNVVDVTTRDASSTEPAYIVDSKFFQAVMARLAGGSFEDLKESLKETIDASTNFTDMAQAIDNRLYISMVFNHPNVSLEPQKEAVAVPVAREEM